MRLQQVDNPLLKLLKHANLHFMKEVGLLEVPHETGNMLKQVESSVHIVH